MAQITNHTVQYVWEEMPLAIALQYDALWWKQYNSKRQLMAFNKVPEILVVEPYNPNLNNSLIV